MQVLYTPVLVPYLNHQLHITLGKSWVLICRQIAGTVEEKLRHRRA